MAEIGISLGINAGGQGVPGWVLNNAALDMYFSQGTYFSATGSPVVTDLLTTTRASTGYAANSSGLLTSFATNTARITDLGLLVEQAATNVVLWNRDLTNAAWTKSNITAALNQTGADGTANAATSLTATAGNGTCLQAITLASSARFQSAWVKRIAGTGTINMTMDNGATWTAITVTAVYTQLTIPTQTLANPTVGFRIVTSGDAIAVDLVGNETGTFATSPITTTTVAVTRAADVVQLSGAALADGLLIPASFRLKFGALNLAGAGTTRALSWSSGGALTIVSNSASLSPAGPSTLFSVPVTTGPTIIASGYDGTNASLASSNQTSFGTGTLNTTTFTGTITLGNLADGTRAINGLLQRITFWGSRLSDAQIQAITT